MNNCLICKFIKQKKIILEHKNCIALEFYNDRKFLITTIEHYKTYWDLSERIKLAISDIIWQIKYMFPEIINWEIKIYSYNNQHVVYEMGEQV